MEKRVVDGEGAIPAHNQPAVIAEPSEGALDNPATSVTAQGAAILRRRLAAAAAMGRDQFDVASRQSSPQRVAMGRDDQSATTELEILGGLLSCDAPQFQLPALSFCPNQSNNLNSSDPFSRISAA